MRKMKKKNINLYQQYEKVVGKENKKKLSKKTIYILCAAAGFAVLGAIFLVFQLQLNSVQDRYDELYFEIYSDSAAEQSVNAERLEYENQVLTQISDSHIKVIGDIESQNKQTQNLSADMISKILACQGADTRIKNISYDKGIVFISGEANDVRHASGFVSELEKTKIFSYISYTGYVLQGDVYIFSATGYFDADDVGKGDTQ